MVSIDTAVKPTNSHLAKIPSLANGSLMTSLQKAVIPLKKGIHAFFNYLKRMDFAPLPDMTHLPMLGTRSRE